MAKPAAAHVTSPAAPAVSRAPLYVAATTAVIEAILVWLLVTGKISAALFVVGHIAVIAGLGGWVYNLSTAGRDVTAATILAIAIGATGPIGAVGGLLSALWPGRPASAKLLDDWYERIALSADVDRVTRLCDDVGSGRHIGLSSPPPASFLAVLERGNLAERQAALGLMARHIDPVYLPALKAALQCSEPVIRVQAAAVATKIRPELRALVDKAVGDFTAGRVTAAQALALATNLEACVASGLLDAGDRIRAETISPRLRLLGATAPVDMAAVTLPQEQMLLQQGRFRELRVARRMAAARGAMGRVRRHVRRLGAGRPGHPDSPNVAPPNLQDNRPSLREPQPVPGGRP